MTQQGWQRLIAQCDDGLASYLTNIKGSTASMSDYSVSLQGNITGYTKITQAIKQYNALGAVSQKEQQNFATAVSLTNTKLGSYLTGLNGAKASLSGYGVSLVASTAKTVGLTIATTALNAALTFGISAIVTGVISAFATWINSSKKITEAAEEAKDKISSINDDLKTNTETVENAKQRYAELAQEVENLGKVSQGQGSLSTDEYKEFLDLSNQLAGVFPQLTKGYDDNGNAILDLSGSVDTIVGSLDDLLQKEKDLANQKIMDEFPDVYKGYIKDLGKAQSEVKSAKAEFDKVNNAYQQLQNSGGAAQAFDLQGNGTFENTDGEQVKVTLAEYEQALKDLDIEYEKTNIMVKNQFGGDTLSGYLINATGDIDTAFTNKLETAKKNLDYAEQQLEGKKSSISSYLNTWLQTEFTYNQIDDAGLQTAVQDMIMNFDFSNLPENVDKDNWNEVSEYLRRNILFAINDVQDNPEISKAISEVFTNQDLTPEEKTNYLQQIKDYFDNLLGEDNAISISLQPQIEDTDALQKSIEKTADRFNDSDKIKDFFDTEGINTDKEVNDFNKITEGINDADKAIQTWNKHKKEANKTPISSDIFSLKDANDNLTTLGKISESIDTIQNAYNTLNSAIDEYNNSGSISIDTFQSIIALGDNWYDYLLDENGALKLDKESLQKLTASRIADMKAQIQQNMIDNVKNITDDASAKEYLTSTNYKTADSIKAVTEEMIEQTLAEKKLLVDSGDLSQENYDLIEKKLRGDIEKINLLKISLDDVSLGGGGSGKIDFIEYRLKELEELANKVQSSIDEAVNVGDKNALLGQMQTVDNAKIDTYNKAISYYQKEASNYLEKIPAELREAAKNGAIAITELIGDNSSEIADYIQQYRDLDNSIAEATEQVSSLRQEVIKLEKEKFDNIVNAFDSIGNIISSNKSIIESQITYLETSGERIGKGYYSSLKEQSNLQLEQLYKERDVLNKQLSTAMSNGVKYGSDEWKDMYSSIQNVDQAIIDTKNDIEGYNNSLRELDWTVFDDTIKSIDTISNKLSNLLDLLKTDKVSGDFSGYSKDAITSMSLNAQKMQTANYVIEKTNKEIANLKASYNKGELSVSEYTERLESLEDTLWNNISTYNSAKEAIIEIAKARINEEVEAIEKVTEANNERISKLKEELQAEKDLQSYKRSLLEKQNDISKLQAQINARMGSTDAETIAEREKLEQELADKLKEIKEMQEDQAYDDMIDSLDKEQDAFEEAQQKKIDTLNNSLEDTETLYNNMLNVIFNNTSITYNRLNELSKQYGFVLEQNITSPWAKGNISSNTFRDTVHRNLNGVSDKFTQLQAKADSISFSKLNSQLGSLNLSTLSTMVSLLSSQINVSGITTGIGNIQSAIENLSKTFETSTKKADDAIKKYGELDKAKKGNDFWVFKTLASYKTRGEASSHFSDYSNYGDVSIIEYGGKSLIVKWLKGFPTSGQASYKVGMLNGSGFYQRYKRGGEITENQNLDVIARSMGEDHIATIAYKEGERILTPEQNKAFLKMVDFSDLIAKSNIIKPFLPSNLSPITTPSLQIGTLLNVEGSIDKNSLPDVQKMLDKSKAEIFNEFGQMLKNKNGCRPR